MIEQLGGSFTSKENNQGANENGRLTAGEFVKVVERLNELIKIANEKVYVTQEEYDALVESGEVQEEVEYNIYD